jgi:hypothetical protein
MLDAASTTSTLIERVKRLTADSSQPRAIGNRERGEWKGSEAGETHGSEDPPLQGLERELNGPSRSGETPPLNAQREEKRGDGERARLDCEESMGQGSMDFDYCQ